jgi:hypothetical protein
MRLFIATVLSGLAIAGSAHAQSPVQVQFGPSTPSLEFGVQTDVIGALGGAKTLGGRFAKRHQDWILTELSYSRISPDYSPVEARVVTAGIRIQDPHPRFGKRGFVTAGIAAADNLSFSWLPVVSFGAQQEMPDGISALRVELQFFGLRRDAPANQYYKDRVRLNIGLTIGIP